jgi:hypothetical protein
VSLWIRQDPEEALVCAEGKEKSKQASLGPPAKLTVAVRKPVDPPPIIQLKIKPDADPMQ